MSREPEDLKEAIEQQLFGDAIDDYGTRLCNDDLTPHCGSCESDAYFGLDDNSYQMEICCDHRADVEKILNELEQSHEQ